MPSPDISPFAAFAHACSRRSLIAATAGAVIVPSLISSPVVMAQGTPPAASPVATPAFATLDELLAAGIEKGVPGIALAVEKAGESVFSGAAGVASLEEQTPLKATDRFRIYSLAKTFVATVVLQLVDEGVLTLHDTVTQWLDDPAVGRIPNVDQITLRQLLTHTSGIYDYLDETSPFWQDAFFGPDADWSRVWTPEELVAYADGAKQAPYFAPGQGEHYSNTGYVLLGLIVEDATGHTFGEELQTRILTPLTLTDTLFVEDANLPEGTIDGYQLIEGELVNVSGTNVSWAWAAGGMVSTAADLTRFARAVFTGELLSPSSFEEMVTVAPGNTYGMGLGVGQSPYGQVAGLTGSSAGFTASMYGLLEADLTVVLLLNMAPDDGTAEAIVNEAIAWALTRPAA
jgi:D-alanyl-D-alanine carboxypeptidase